MSKDIVSRETIEYKKTMNSKRMRNCASKWNANTTKKIF